jgi:hypothetical protein
MNKSLEVLKQIYKPYRYTIKGNVVILNTSMGDFVVKEKSDVDIKTLYQYLSSRSFNNYPLLVDDNRNNVNVYEYLDSVEMPSEQKAIDLIDLISNLHNKTSFYKSVTEDTFKEIYENIKSNIDYLKNYYDNLYENIKKEIYMSPSSYYLIRNISKIFASLEFCQSELDKWLLEVKNQTKKRVCLIHNHVNLEHYIKKDKEYLISWEKSRIDSPILDLVEFYESDYFNITFDVLLERYFEKVGISDDEKKLFFILISLPKKIEFKLTEFESCKVIRNAMDYLFITEKLVRPYYTIEQEN